MQYWNPLVLWGGQAKSANESTFEAESSAQAKRQDGHSIYFFPPPAPSNLPKPTESQHAILKMASCSPKQNPLTHLVRECQCHSWLQFSLPLSGQVDIHNLTRKEKDVNNVWEVTKIDTHEIQRFAGRLAQICQNSQPAHPKLLVGILNSEFSVQICANQPANLCTCRASL